MIVEMVEIRYSRQGISAEDKEPRGWHKFLKEQDVEADIGSLREEVAGSAHAHKESPR